MYTSYIGKKFMEYYKEEYNKPDSYTAKEFFDEVMFPLFFNDKRHLMHVTNSPFFQGVKKEELEKSKTITNAQKKKFETKIIEGNYGGEMLVGYGSSDVFATTSGQLSNLKITHTEEDVYYSWIGQALAIAVKGGIANLIDKKEILLLLFKGWKEYSSFLDQSPGLKDKQIETWNGNYLIQMLNNRDNEFDFLKIDIDSTKENKAIQTIQWPELIFELCKFYKNTVLHSYVYILGQTNTTIGMITFFLKEINKMYELRDMLFLDEKTTVLSDYQIKRLLPFYSFYDACKKGTIGLKSIEPKGLRNYIPKGTLNFAKGNDIDIKKENNFFIYQLWIMAMLNKKELLDLSRQFAAVLHTAVKDMKRSHRSKTTDIQFVRELFDSRSPKHFIEQITELIDKNNFDTLRKLVEEVSLMPKDNFPYFVTLIKFEYNVLLNKED